MGILLILLFFATLFEQPFGFSWQENGAEVLDPNEDSLSVDKLLLLEEPLRQVEPLLPEGEEIVMKPQVILETRSPVDGFQSISTHRVVISSLPLGALVFIDGKAVGRTLPQFITQKGNIILSFILVTDRLNVRSI